MKKKKERTKGQGKEAKRKKKNEKKEKKKKERDRTLSNLLSSMTQKELARMRNTFAQNISTYQLCVGLSI